MEELKVGGGNIPERAYTHVVLSFMFAFVCGCVCVVCVHVCIHVCMYLSLHQCKWRFVCTPSNAHSCACQSWDVGFPSWISLYLFHRDKVFRASMCRQLASGTLCLHFLSTSIRVRLYAHPSINLGPGTLNSGLQTCIVSSLPTEPSHHPPYVVIFTYYLFKKRQGPFVVMAGWNSLCRTGCLQTHRATCLCLLTSVIEGLCPHIRLHVVVLGSVYKKGW